MITTDELKVQLADYGTAVKDLEEALAIDASRKRVQELEHTMSRPGFYDDAELSKKVFDEVGDLKGKLNRFEKLQGLYDDAETMLVMLDEEYDPDMVPEAEEAVNAVGKAVDELQLMTMLNGEYDHSNAILTFHAGTGVEGQDSVAVVVLTVQHGHQLQLVHSLAHGVHGFLCLGHHIGVVLLVQHHQHGLGIIVQALQLFKAVQLALQVAHFIKDLLAQLSVIIEAGAAHGVLQLLHALAGSVDGQRFLQVLHSGAVIGQLHFQFVSSNHILRIPQKIQFIHRYFISIPRIHDKVKRKNTQPTGILKIFAFSFLF